MKNAEGEWSGIAVELWERIAGDLGFTVEWQETTLQGLLEGIRDGKLDASVAALTMTSEREAMADFTHPFLTSGLGIAAPTQERAGMGAILKRVVSMQFAKALLVLILVLAAAGFLLWLFERRRNPEQFGGRAARGFGNAFWWSAVTMTTVGYGDKAPVTWAGRLVAMVWMFVSIIVIASLTASIASALTVSQLESSVHGPEDLPGLTVGSVPQSTSALWLAQHGVRRRSYAKVEDALAGLARGECDAVVYDHPLLVHYVGQDESLRSAITVLPRTFARQAYAFALPQDSKWRERVNREILKQLSSPAWEELVQRYLGP